MIVFALDDDAFESGIKSAEDTFRVPVQTTRRNVQLRFKEIMLGTPIFARLFLLPRGSAHIQLRRYNTPLPSITFNG